MPGQRLFLIFLLLGTFVLRAVAAPVTSHDADIDHVRAEIKIAPTTAETYRERSLLMFLWLAALQQQGADTHPFFDIDKKYYQLEDAVLNKQGSEGGAQPLAYPFREPLGSRADHLSGIGKECKTIIQLEKPHSRPPPGEAGGPLGA